MITGDGLFEELTERVLRGERTKGLTLRGPTERRRETAPLKGVLIRENGRRWEAVEVEESMKTSDEDILVVAKQSRSNLDVLCLWVWKIIGRLWRLSRSRDRERSAVFQKSFFKSKAASVAFYREELGEWCFSILFMKMNQTLRFTAFTVACSCVLHGLDLT